MNNIGMKKGEINIMSAGVGVGKSQLSPPRIVCAANLYEDGTIVLGARHFDPLMHKTIDAIGLRDFPQPKQGFIDQHRNFINRKDAWKIAKANNQIFQLCGGQSIYTDDEELYSENLY